MTRARSRADEKRTNEGATADANATIVAERGREDLELAKERATADEKLEGERDERRRAIAALLALERTQTDANLLGERDFADTAVFSRDDFLAMVSHDLRNMLGGLAMSAASLLRIGEAGPRGVSITRDAERIQRYSARMIRLVSDLLDLTSIEAGRLAVVPQWHVATELLRETQDVFEPIASAKDVSIRTEVKADSLLARYDEERILQVLANLVGNAIKFTRPGGRVDVLVEPIGTEIRFAVSDTGCGIASDQLGAIFDRFWQKTRQRSGLGLGLYIARCIVEAHGGRIWAESKLGEGSTLYFTLPAASPATPESRT
jgi:signal transduction histidine kinase